MEFKPRIVAFLCNWCSYTGADIAGPSRMEYKANVRAIRVMSSGRELALSPALPFLPLQSREDILLTSRYLHK